MFRDISRGYTTAKLFDTEVYIKHLTTHDQVDLEEIKDKYYSEAEFRGAPTEKDMLAVLKDSGDWVEEDEKEIEEIKNFIDILRSQKSHLLLKSKIDQQNELISKEELKLTIKLNEKKQLLGATCEKYAEERANDSYIIRSFFYDTKFEEPVFTEELYADLDNQHLSQIIAVYNESFKTYSEEHTKKP